MSAPRALFTRKQLLDLVVELRKVEELGSPAPEAIETEVTEVQEREQSWPAMLGG